MTPLHLATLALFVVTAAAAVTLAKKDKRNRPVAWYLAAVVALELFRFGLRRLLPIPPPSGPLEGWARIVRHADLATYLGLIMVLPAMTMALFLRRRPWLIGVLYVAICAVLISSYPTIRGDELMLIYTAIELAGVIASIGFFIMWLRSPRLLEEGNSVPIMSGATLMAASLAAAVLPQMTGPKLLAQWQLVVAGNALTLALVLVFQLRYLLAGKGKL